jgi:hypothetical protein
MMPAEARHPGTQSDPGRWHANEARQRDDLMLLLASLAA